MIFLHFKSLPWITVGMSQQSQFHLDDQTQIHVLKNVLVPLQHVI